MPTAVDLRTEAKRLMLEAQGILSMPDATAEQLQRVEPLMEDARQKRANALRLDEIEANLRDMEQSANATSAAQPPASPEKFATWREFLKGVYALQFGTNLQPDVRAALMRKARAFKDVDPEDVQFGLDKKDLVEGVGASGGFLVPAEFQAELMAHIEGATIARPRATIIRMGSRQRTIPVLDQTGTTAGVPHWFGGLQVYYQEEASAKTASDPVFRQMTLTAHKMIMYTRASDELVSDSAISLEDFLTGPLGFSGAIAWTEDYMYLRGNGTGKPLGILNAPATITHNRAVQANVTYEDLTAMLEKFLPSGQGMWIASQSLMSKLLAMSGPTANPSYVWGNATNGVPNVLLGMPIVFTEKLPRVTTTSVGDLALVDWRYYLIGDRQATTVESTKFDRWQYDQTSWRAVFRHDGRPWLSAPFTYEDGTTQVSPFVILGAKST